MPFARRLRPLVAGALLIVLPLAAQAEEVVVFAAASLKTALEDIAADYEARTGDEITISFAGSSALARQIQQGAPADIFISANEAWMDELETDGLLEPGTRSDLLRNSIVLIAHGTEAEPVEISDALDLPALLGDGRLAMALVDAVPAGIYGKAALESLGLWPQVAPRVAQADNVRAALALVSTGEAPLGIVYATDAAADKAVSVIGTFPEDSHAPIIYPAARLSGRDGVAAADFLSHLHGDEARAVFEAQGFVMAAPAGTGS
ncbi:molybdate ABC transporter substrate-binding protein [Salipiger mangrovisoli]|uniref:Molybdate ABC transporter substrate-binding protein n=1 Tax=Salipiger mangrovisoli TaxID=2865933 RepID=A0ABR9WXS6_9RHOB|nr:molybdate ABC transporter substrate-binding protein [Salipiger mangrovisoli]MBE9636098.1 molybdate ABC transporter substrate-binding protein [Salipiger mangrovisoli]